MLGALAYALLSGPFVTMPLPVVTGDPTLIAIASDPAQMRLYCFSTRCGDEEWRLALAPPRDPIIPARREAPPPLPGSQRYAALSAPATPRESRELYSNDYRIGGRFGVQALRNGPTELGLKLGAGYRLAPLHDDGINRPGAVFRGELNFGQRFGERARWTQRVQFESGHGEAFVKQSVSLDVNLWPNWTLESDFAIRHDTQSGGGSETAESTIELRRRF
ncbi:DUF481 domain-containing protein [Vulcaniibacterium tengchongense]|uniref:Uncharacterized protein DUF481 n=1 Tax=Vulcaniibacterium tengchongense TaxID=1273429 RepID=A0A3N4VDC1_9GAMM|nr:DUF481 domain-containing protein [Vulcaniibacterium tengchongense]RPE79793.1 uncharacterized protein DUF481 [Vulcaniibacterium tengchongense]